MDEPIIEFDPLRGKHNKISEDKNLSDAIGRLLKNELYGVLATQKSGQPYASLLAFANSRDLKTIVFSTPKNTRKYKLIESCKRVAFQIDNRAGHLDEFMAIESITATGRVVEISKKSRSFKKWSKLLTTKHPYLESFLQSPSCALIIIDIMRYFHVVRFQEVTILKA